MSQFLQRLLVFPLLAFCLSAHGAGDDEKDNTLDKYLVDVTGGVVSAGGIVGVDKSAIQSIETSQDLVLAVRPFTSGDTKTGFGLAITPARTPLAPLSARSYYQSDFYRLLGGVTFSYAQAKQDIAGVSYDKSGYSIDATYYLHKADDPIVIAHLAYDGCKTSPQVMLKATQDLPAGKITQDEFNKIMAEQQALQAGIYKDCVDKAAAGARKTRWNAPRFNVSYGMGTIKQPGGPGFSLGRLLTINGVIPWGPGATYLSARTVRHAIDSTTIATTPAYKGSTLYAARYTLGSQVENDDGRVLRALVEVSNAKDTSPSVFKDAFMRAVGLDWHVSPGIWLEFRIGRNRSLLNGKEETTSLLNLNISPSTTLFTPAK
jgi:hypothetical protein